MSTIKQERPENKRMWYIEEIEVDVIFTIILQLYCIIYMDSSTKTHQLCIW